MSGNESGLEVNLQRKESETKKIMKEKYVTKLTKAKDTMKIELPIKLQMQDHLLLQ